MQNYIPQFSDELRLERGQVTEVLEKSLDGWWKVRYVRFQLKYNTSWTVDKNGN